VSAHPDSFLAGLFRSSPLRHAPFRRFYIGSIGAALGYTMQGTVAAWLMATLTTSALMVALVQTASTAPSLLFGLLAGALADIVDRRRVVLVTQVVLWVATVVLGIATLAGLMGPQSLLVFTFLIGAGFTFYMPAQQASVNDFVARAEVPRAVALGAVAYNLARAVGPAIAGAIVTVAGSGTASLVSACFFLLMVAAVRSWKSGERPLPGVPETLISGVQTGLRYARHSPLLRALIIRNLTFSICASALWALLPVIARDQLGLGAGGFGLLSAGFGCGAIVGALTIPRQLQRLGLNRVVTMGALLWTAAVALIAWADHTALAMAGMFGTGAAWVSVLASLSAGTQSAAPAWVRARAVAMALVAVQASLAVGSVIWGSLATYAGLRVALVASAGTLLVLVFASRWLPVQMGDAADVTPGARLPELSLAEAPSPDDGPVLIQVEYRIAPENRARFLHEIHLIEPIRRRNGANAWRVFRDVGEDGRFVERFVITSWAEYVRLRSRMTMSDRQLLDRVQQLHQSDAPLQVARLIGIDPGSATSAAPRFDPD
jgi:MFS family permease